MLLKRGHVFVVAAFLAAGCGTRTTTTATFDPTELAAPVASRGAGSLELRIEAAAAEAERQVQFTQSKAARTLADVAQYKIELFKSGTNTASFTATVGKKTANSSSDAYTLQNVPTGSFNLVVSALDSTGANITKNGSATAAVTVTDQTTAQVAVSVALLDGVAANGDISATVNVQNGTLVAPAVSVL